MSFSLFLSWRSQSDLLAGLEALRHLSRACQSSFAPAAKQAMLGDVVYGGYVTNGLDLHAVESLAKFVPSEQMKVVLFYLLYFSLSAAWVLFRFYCCCSFDVFGSFARLFNLVHVN